MPVLGVISDTHSLLRPDVLKVFRSVDQILHAGDIGRPEILDELKTIAPVVAVRGNNDKGAWAKRIPESKRITIANTSIFLIHDIKEIPLLRDPVSADVIISGHSHKPSIERRDGVLYLNPGSAGPRRFKLPTCVAKLTVQESGVSALIIDLI